MERTDCQRARSVGNGPPLSLRRQRHDDRNDVVPKTIRAAFEYFAIVLGTGFVLGVFRVPILVPRIGERWAELVEMPIMATVIFLAAGFILRRFPEIHSPRRTLMAGFLALALSVASELGLAVLLQDQTLIQFLRSRDKVSGLVYLGLLIVFSLMLRIRLSAMGPRVP